VTGLIIRIKKLDSSQLPPSAYLKIHVEEIQQTRRVGRDLKNFDVDCASEGFIVCNEG